MKILFDRLALSWDMVVEITKKRRSSIFHIITVLEPKNNKKTRSFLIKQNFAIALESEIRA